MRLALTPTILLASLLSGCSAATTMSTQPVTLPAPDPPSTPAATVAISGFVKTGQKPISGAHVYLFAANSTGYGEPSVALLSASSTGSSDAYGAYVLTDTTGSFSIPSFTCIAKSQVYLYSLGGDAGVGNNVAAGLMAILGTCPPNGSFLATLPSVTVNEVTTVAAAYAFAGFATDATHVASSGTSLAQTGIANAFLNASSLASVTTGQALSVIPSGLAKAPAQNVNTIANLLAACVSSSGPTSAACAMLLPHALAGGTAGNAPTDTATAAINIAHHPGLNVPDLYYGLMPDKGPFSPTVGSLPGDFVLGLFFNKVNGNGGIAIDAQGSAWIADIGGNSVTKVSSSGTLLSGSSGFNGGGLTAPASVAVDDDSNVWITSSSSASGSIVKFSNSGSLLSGASGFTAGGINDPRRIAIGGDGSVWITNEPNSIVKLSSSGSSLSGDAGFSFPGLTRTAAIAVDSSGNAWVTSFGETSSLYKISGSGALLSGSAGYSLSDCVTDSLAIDAADNIWTGCLGQFTYKSSNAGVTLLSVPEYVSSSLAVDGANNIWVADEESSGLHEISNAGVNLSGPFAYNAGILLDPTFVALDGSGDAWVSNANYGDSGLAEIIGVAVPVVTPIATGLKNRTLGTRP